MNVHGKIKVAIADDHPAVRDGVHRLLEQSNEIEVVGEASNGQEALDLVTDLVPDVLILDILMPVMDGITVIEVLQTMDVPTAVLVLSAIDDPVFKEESIARGACDYLSKDQAAHLIELVQHAAHGDCGNADPEAGLSPVHCVKVF